MNRVLSGLLLVTLLFGTGYLYYVSSSTCRIPYKYSIGSIDPRFELSFDEVRTAVTDAESLWEDATGKNLFTYDKNARFKINFIFDDRQETTIEVGEYKEELDAKQSESESIRAEYERLIKQYEDLKVQYEAAAKAYEENLAEHNREVQEWNEKGGAPQHIYFELQTRQQTLAGEHQQLNTIANELNSLVAQINAVGERGNRFVTDYNDNVREYNDRFNHSREFTQGDYQGDSINIYQFDNAEELRLVLAHEFGHTLSLGHVENEQSVMYYLMEEQQYAKLADAVISVYDLEEFDRVCGKRSGFTFLNSLTEAFTQSN